MRGGEKRRRENERGKELKKEKELQRRPCAVNAFGKKHIVAQPEHFLKSDGGVDSPPASVVAGLLTAVGSWVPMGS